MLELGCGDGRIAQTLAEAGRLVTGVDSHPGMLAQAEVRRAQLNQALQLRLDYRLADIRDFKIDALFDYVIMPFTTVFCLDDAGRSSCFRRVLTHLKPGGQFIFDTYCADVFESPEWQDDEEFEPLTNIIEGDRYIEVFEKTVVDQVRGIASVTYGHEVREKDGSSLWSEYTIEHHYCSAETLAMHLEAAGFEEIQIASGFPSGCATTDDARILLWAHRPKALRSEP